MSFTGFTVPTAFETWLNATTRVRDPTRPRRASRSTLVLGERTYPERGTACTRHLLPRNEIGVMLEPGDDDLVAGLNIGVSPCGRHEGEGLRRSAREDEAIRVGESDEPCNARARISIRLCRAYGPYI